VARTQSHVDQALTGSKKDLQAHAGQQPGDNGGHAAKPDASVKAAGGER
jgi:hypothetical protein